MGLQRLERGVVVIGTAEEGAHDLLKGHAPPQVGQPDLLHLHGPLGQGARLVQAQGVHMGQGLQGKQLLHQHLLLGQHGDAGGQADADQHATSPLGSIPSRAAAVVMTDSSRAALRRK